MFRFVILDKLTPSVLANGPREIDGIIRIVSVKLSPANIGYYIPSFSVSNSGERK